MCLLRCQWLGHGTTSTDIARFVTKNAMISNQQVLLESELQCQKYGHQHGDLRGQNLCIEEVACKEQ